MIPGKFDYYRAESVDHALDLLDDNPGAELIAGGHSLVPTMKSGLSNPDALVDVGGLDALSGIESDDDSVTIGAMTNYAAVADSDRLWEDVAVIAQAAHEVGDIQVRNRGTIGGNVAHADPASDIPAAVRAADATIHARGPDGDRTIPADDFFHGMYATGLGADEILTAVEFPVQAETTGSAYVKKPSPSSGYALVGVAAVVESDGDEITDARVAANGVMDHAVRLDPVEESLVGASLDDEERFADAAEQADDDLDEFMIMDDIQASPEFRAQLLRVHTEDALQEAVDRIGKPAAAH
jgi:carbon-monoxide dehydrogenase medium subunit